MTVAWRADGVFGQWVSGVVTGPGARVDLYLEDDTDLPRLGICLHGGVGRWPPLTTFAPDAAGEPQESGTTTIVDAGVASRLRLPGHPWSGSVALGFSRLDLPEAAMAPVAMVGLEAELRRGLQGGGWGLVAGAHGAWGQTLSPLDATPTDELWRVGVWLGLSAGFTPGG